MSTELAIQDQMKYAEIVVHGDIAPQAYRNKPANALIAIGLGQAMGLSPAESLYRIDVIQGKPTASAELIASNVRRAGHKLRVRVDEANQSVTATIIRADDPDYEHTVVRDMEWAKTMGLHTKDNYKKQPLTMLQWRAISAVARLACSEALYGVAYTGDELSDLGETSAPAEPAPAQPKTKVTRKAKPQAPAPELPAAVHDAPREDEPETVEAEAVEEEAAPLASAEQIKALVAALVAAGYETAAQRTAAITEVLGAPRKPADMTAEEADVLIATFEAKAQTVDAETGELFES